VARAPERAAARLARRERAAVRLLPVGPADERRRAARGESAPDARADQGPHEHQRLPLRDLPSDHVRHRARRAGGLAMTTRREFMVGVSGLTFGIFLEGCAATREIRERSGASLAQTPAGGARAVNAWASLSPDGTIWIVNPAVEMGQGSQTAIPLIIAEEMDADWSRVVIVPAAPDDKVYGNPGFRGLMYTAGSATVTGYWDVARTFGAQVRRVMMENAARLWNVPLAELSTEPSTVVHAKSGRRLGYGEIAAVAQLPAAAPAIKPEELKEPGQYRLIGKDVMRVDLTRSGKPWDSAGDAPAAMQKAAKIYESEYICDYTYHAQMEPLNSVASVSAAGDACEIWCGTQSQTMAVAAVAKALGIAPEKVKLNLMLLGGGFGRRGHRDEEFVVDSVLLSKEVKRPVKVLWTREDDVKNGRFRPLSVHYLRAGLDGAGRIVAWQHRVACDEITAFQDPVRYKGGGERDFLAMAGSELRTYDIANRLSEQLPQQ